MMIRKTTEADLSAVMNIINLAKEYFRSQGIDQWQRGNPNEEAIRADMANQCSYVLEDNGEVVGTCCIWPTVDPNYAHIEEGAWLNDDPYIVIHRIAVHPDRKGQRLGAQFFAFAKTKAEQMGISNLRIDTHPENLSMQKLIARNAFTKCGNVYVGQHELRYAYQKQLNTK